MGGGRGEASEPPRRAQQQGCKRQSGEIPTQRTSADQHSPASEACLLTRWGRWGLGAEARASEVRSQGDDWGWLCEHSLKGASVPQLAGGSPEKVWKRLRGKRALFQGVRGEGIQRTTLMSSRDRRETGYQRGHKRRAWNTKAAAAAIMKPVCEHRSPSTPPLLGACAACHCQGPMIQGQLPWENTLCTSGCCNVTLTSAAAGLPRILYPSIPLSWVSQSPLIRCYLNPFLSGRRTDILRWPTHRGGAKSKAELQELYEQRRERDISPSSLRSSGLNLHNQLEVPCNSGIPE